MVTIDWKPDEFEEWTETGKAVGQGLSVCGKQQGKMDSVEKEWAHSLIRTERAVNGIKYSDPMYQTTNAKKKKKKKNRGAV